MFQDDESRDYYRMKYIPEFIIKLEREVQKVDDRIRKSIKRIDAPMPDRVGASNEFQGTFDQKEATLESIEALDKKIDYYLQEANKKGEEGELE